MELHRVYETAEEEGKSVLEVALERHGSLEAFGEALEERWILDERADTARPQKANRGNERKSGGVETRYSCSDQSRPTSQNSFRRPDEGGPSTPPTSANPLPNPTLQLIDASTHYVLHQMWNPQAPNRKLLPRALQFL